MQNQINSNTCISIVHEYSSICEVLEKWINFVIWILILASLLYRIAYVWSFVIGLLYWHILNLIFTCHGLWFDTVIPRIHLLDFVVIIANYILSLKHLYYSNLPYRFHDYSYLYFVSKNSRGLWLVNY